MNNNNYTNSKTLQNLFINDLIDNNNLIQPTTTMNETNIPNAIMLTILQSSSLTLIFIALFIISEVMGLYNKSKCKKNTVEDEIVGFENNTIIVEPKPATLAESSNGILHIIFNMITKKYRK